MTQLITDDVKQNIRSPLDIEKFSQRFKTENDLFTFPDPNLLTLDKNLYYLLRNSKEVPFNSKYKYRPDYLSYDYYGTVMLWQLLMYVNTVFSIEDFDLNIVIIPSLNAITFILQDTFQIDEPQDLQAIDW